METNWNKISWGKCKHAYLLIAYSKGININDAEKEAEKWADRSMRSLRELDEEAQDQMLADEIATKSAQNNLFN